MTLEQSLAAARRAARWLGGHPGLIFGLWALSLSALYFLFGPASYVKVMDAGNGTLPARMWAGQALWTGHYGDWMPLSCCGADRSLNGYRLELPSLLFALMPGWLAYGTILFAQRFVAGYFFFRLMRDELGAGQAAGFVTGMAYSLYYQPHLYLQWDGFTLYEGLGVPALPLLVWGIHRFHERKSPWVFVMAATTGAVLALSAHYFQTLFFPFLLLFWLTCIRRILDLRMLGLLFAIGTGWGLVTLPHLLAAVQFAPLSHRADLVISSTSDYTRYLENVEPWPWFVVGSNRVLLGFGLVGLVAGRFKDRRLLWSLVSLAAIFLFVSHYYFFSDHVFGLLGPLKSFNFHRLIYLTPFLIALSAGLGVRALANDWRLILTDDRRRRVFPLAAVPAAICIAYLLHLSAHVQEDRYKAAVYGESYILLYRHPDVEAIADLKSSSPPFRVASVVDALREGETMWQTGEWTFAPGYAWAYDLETADGYLVLYPDRYKQFWSRVLTPLLARDLNRYHRHESWGNMVYLWAPSSGRQGRRFAEWYDLDLLSLANVRFVFSPYPLEDPRLELVPSEQREKLLQRQEWSAAERIRGGARGEWAWRPIYIYENREVLPRYRFVGEVRLLDGAQATLDALGRMTAEELDRAVVFDRDDVRNRSFESLSGASGSVELLEESADRLVLDVTCTGPGLVTLANTYHPNWHATVDGQPVEILPANYTFQGIPVDGGTHRIELSYVGAHRWSSLRAGFSRR